MRSGTLIEGERVAGPMGLAVVVLAHFGYEFGLTKVGPGAGLHAVSMIRLRGAHCPLFAMFALTGVCVFRGSLSCTGLLEAPRRPGELPETRVADAFSRSFPTAVPRLLAIESITFRASKAKIRCGLH